MNDLDRWVDLEGPEPDDIRELLDAARDDRTPEEEARLERRLFDAITEDHRRWARKRMVIRALGLGALAACLACAFVRARSLVVPVDLTVAWRYLENASGVLSTHVGGALRPEPSVEPAGAESQPEPASARH